MKTEAQLRQEYRSRIKDSPGFFVRNVLGDGLWQQQEAIIASVKAHAKTAVRSCHGAGKSFVAGRTALWFLLAHPHSIVITTAPTFRQVEKVLWKEIRSAVRDSRVDLGFKPLMTEIKLDSDWLAFGFATDVPDNFQGMHAKWILVIIDEASGLPAELWEAIEGVLSGGNSRELAIGNPTDPSGEFAGMFREPGVAKFHVSAFDTPNFTATGITQEDIESGAWRNKAKAYLDEHGAYPYPALVTPEWVAGRLKRWGAGSALYQARVLGEFPKEGANTLIPLAWVEAAQRRSQEPSQEEWERWRESSEDNPYLPEPDRPHILGVDVAWEGDDSSTLYLRKSLVIRRRAILHGLDPMKVTGEMIALMNDEDVNCANVDVIGIGAGVAARGRELNYPVQAINVARNAYDEERFANLRAEIFWNLREALDPKNPRAIDLDPEDEELLEELVAFRFGHNSKGQMILEPKKETKKRLGRSPDRADGVALSLIPQLVDFEAEDDEDGIIYHEEEVSISPV